MVLNIRAEVSPEKIKGIVDDIIEVYAEEGFKFHVLELKHLSPGRPQPTHRYEEIVE
ncbi:hypothetical protein QQ008_23345 [Fulvivirgaceae bacterium BMA10]|uniref:4-oxalocrotonate tautomerase n=1 Tax=Splendidivirga corallicola TaxID=3051826 RepID=A0ABT8KWM0_9BACT|nr:hypothetical protein [Fulvivirgaceae bacterium BMA10]